MKANMEHHLLRDFVSPVYCVYLVEQGMNIETPYYWRITNEEARLMTHVFDIDESHRQALANQDYINPIVKKLPAFSLGDMQLIIPDYFLSRHYGAFTLSCDKMFGLDDVSADRMPDAFAIMALQCFRTKITNIELATKKMMNL
jgi:hypothetical protein